MKIHDYSTSSNQSQLSYLAEEKMDMVSGEFISQIQENMQQIDTTLTCQVSTKQ